jgi:hypothetical protein
LSFSDDLMKPLFRDPYMQNFFANEVHGWNTSVIYTVQNYFPEKKDSTIIRQTHYKIIFNDVSDEALIASISQKFSRRSSFLTECFDKLEKCYPDEKRHYICIDSHFQSRGKSLKLFIKSHIFPTEDNKIRPIFFLK